MTSPERHHFFAGKKIVITGGVGSVGREIAVQLRRYSPDLIRIIDNNESGLFDMESQTGGDGLLEFLHVEITDEVELRRAFFGMDLCFHCAALKHVPSCERSPFGAINVNVKGLHSLIQAARAERLKRVTFTSSDKAVNPPSVMGATKLLGERLMTAANFMSSTESRRVIFSSTRFGNVAGSRGSVIPLFVEQIRRGGPVTITDPRMTRFVMTLDEAADLVLESMLYALPGDVLITKMAALRIVDLADVMIKMLAPVFGYRPEAIDVSIVGARPAEKLWEELSTDEESSRLLESDRFLCVLPAMVRRTAEEMQRYEEIGFKPSDKIYSSEKVPLLSESEIADFLLKPGVFEASLRQRIKVPGPLVARSGRR